jgi:hypothetical protein
MAVGGGRVCPGRFSQGGTRRGAGEDGGGGEEGAHGGNQGGAAEKCLESTARGAQFGLNWRRKKADVQLVRSERREK